MQCVWYWTGGTLGGEWKAAFPGVYPARQSIESLKTEIRRMGYVAYYGSLEIGPPDDPPTKAEIDAVLS